MDHIKLAAQPRELMGKKVARLRRVGIVPVVVYGGALPEPLSLQVGAKELGRALNAAGTARVIDLQMDNLSVPVLTREVQRDVLRHEIIHVDFLSVRMDQTIQAEVPVVLVGEPELVANKEAVLLHPLSTLLVEALPDNLPTHIEVDVSALTDFGQQLTVADLKVGPNVRLVTDSETLVASLASPSREEVPTTAPSDEPEAARANQGNSDDGDEG